MAGKVYKGKEAIALAEKHGTGKVWLRTSQGGIKGNGGARLGAFCTLAAAKKANPAHITGGYKGTK